MFGFEARTAQSRGEYPGSRMTFRDAEDFLSEGFSVLLLSRLPLLVGTRSPDAADGGGMRELPACGRGGCRVFVGGARFGCGVGRGRGAAGGGIRELAFALVVERVGGRRCGCDDGGVRDGGCGDLVSEV